MLSLCDPLSAVDRKRQNVARSGVYVSSLALSTPHLLQRRPFLLRLQLSLTSHFPTDFHPSTSSPSSSSPSILA